MEGELEKKKEKEMVSFICNSDAFHPAACAVSQSK